MLQLIASGILLLPAAIVMIATAPVVALLALPAAALLSFRKRKSTAHPKDEYRRAIITGGSSGIGLAVAEECVKKGFDQVVILARSPDKLKTAKASLEKACTKSSTTVVALSVDVTNLKKLQEAAMEIFEKKKKGSTYLFCCAGKATPYRFLDLTEEIIMDNTKTNQLGATFTVRAMLPHMQSGTIVLCSSVSHLECNIRRAHQDDTRADIVVSNVVLCRFLTDGRASRSFWFGSVCSIQICSCWSCPGIAHGTLQYVSFEISSCPNQPLHPTCSQHLTFALFVHLLQTDQCLLCVPTGYGYTWICC